MRSSRLPDTPFWALFRLKWKQTWPRSRVRTALLAFVCILAVQVLVTYVLAGAAYGPNSAPWWLTRIASLLGLVSSAWMPFLVAHNPSVFVPLIATPTSVLVGLADVATQFIMPAFAALSIAPERASGRVDEYRLAGLRPAQILAACGLAALLPFALLLLAAVLLAILLAAPMATIRSGSTDSAFWLNTLMLLIRVDQIAFSTAAFLVRAGIFVSISALCRRPYKALVLCYAVGWVMLWVPWPAWGLLIRLGTGLGVLGVVGWAIAPHAMGLPAMAVLLRLALRSLGRGDT